MGVPTVNPEKLRGFATCQVEVDPGGVISSTKGTVQIRFPRTSGNLTADQWGMAPAEVVGTGGGFEAVVPFAEFSLDILHRLLPGTRLVVDQADPTKRKLVGLPGTGQQAIRDNLTVKLIFKPIVNNLVSTDETEWLTVWKAWFGGSPEWAWDIGGQRVLSANVTGLPDPDHDGAAWTMGYVSANS